jgi:hypothetical protein
MDAMPYRTCSLRAGNPDACMAIQGALKKAPKASTEPSLKGMMLKMVDGHTRPQCATCPLWMAVLRI